MPEPQSPRPIVALSAATALPTTGGLGTPVLTAVPTEPAPAIALTPEEQMALYEQNLKETDWGHQPC